MTFQTFALLMTLWAWGPYECRRRALLCLVRGSILAIPRPSGSYRRAQIGDYEHQYVSFYFSDCENPRFGPPKRQINVGGMDRSPRVSSGGWVVQARYLYTWRTSEERMHREVTSAFIALILIFMETIT